MSAAVTSSFSDFKLIPELLQAVADVGYETPSQIQAESIPPLLEGRNIIGQAQTGTGKTAAFALPLLQKLDSDKRFPQALVLTPTRELALQVSEAIHSYAKHLPALHVLPVYGGQGMDAQLRGLKRGAQVVVGTPGRVMDHLRRGSLKLDGLRMVVLDEADEMLKMGFLEDVEWILEHAPAERQGALFSATMPDPIRRIAERHLKDAVTIKVKTRTTTVEAVTQRYWQVSGLHKLDALTRVLETEAFEAIIIFVRTKTATVELAEKLEARGYAAAALNGDLNQTMRQKTVDRLKAGTLDILVATDVAARGLDVQRVSHVINYDIPHDVEAYVHRIGRTGRAGRTGQAILFVSPREIRMLKTIERATRQTIAPMRMPTRQDVANRRIELFKQRISTTLAESPEDVAFFEELLEQFRSESGESAERVAAALATLAQGDRSLRELSAKPERAERTERPDRENRQDRGGAERGGREDRPGRSERAPRAERPARAAREERGERPPRGERLNIDAVRYRINVGRQHGVRPQDIVGAIANEAGIAGEAIGQIKLYDDSSTVELPSGLPKDLIRLLKKVRVCDQKLDLRPDDEESGARGFQAPRAHRNKKAPRGFRPGDSRRRK